MSSLGADAYAGTLTVNQLNYQTLNPPIGGFVNNPLTGTLDCGGNDLTNAGTITTGILNYTSLNPPIPTGFVNNPMTVALAGGNQDINNVNTITTNGAITAGGNIDGVEIIASSKLEGANGLVSGNWEVGGNLTVETPGLARFKGGVLVDANGVSTFNNRVVFNQPPQYNPSLYGTLASPIALTNSTPSAGITTFVLAPGKTSVVVFGHPSPTQDSYSTFEIDTPFPNVLEEYAITVSLQNTSVGVASAIPNQFLNIGRSEKSPADTDKFQVFMEHGAVPGYTTQVLMYVVQLNYVRP